MPDVTPDRWRAELANLASSGHAFLDVLTVVDRGDVLEIVAHVIDPDHMAAVLVTTRVEAGDPVVDSIVTVFPGAAWHEREAAEMFGVRFVGNPDLRPLLTDGSVPPLLRTSTPLPARVTTAWPGADESSRRRARVPGVRDEWAGAS